MNDTQIQELQETFNIFDSKGDGMIAVKQVGDVLRAMGQNPTEADIAKCLSGTAQEEAGPEGRLSWETFLPILQSVNKGKDKYSGEDIAEGMRHFDNEGNGFIKAADLRHLLTALGEKLTEDEVEQLMDGVTVDDEGKVNYENFIRQIMNG